MEIVIFGTGYVGLVTGACIAHATKHSVTCVDIDSAKIANLEKGIMPIYEPELSEIVVEGFKSKKLQFTTDASTVINNADCIFIAVGTPPAEDGSADLKYVLKVAEEIGQTLIRENTTIVVKSTVPVGTCKLVKDTIALNLKSPVEFTVASNPEFLREGSAVKDFIFPERIVIGIDADASYARSALNDLYSSISDCILEYDVCTSEMIKYASNAMLATRISFMNEVAKICQEVGANVTDVANGMGYDSRIGPKFLAAGLGYGGSCFPKDVQALSRLGKQVGVNTPLLDTVHLVNESMIQYASDLVLAQTYTDPTELTFNFIGLAFKPNTDDTRESASIKLIENLADRGCRINVYDPIVKSYVSPRNSNMINVVQTAEEFTKLTADAVVIGTDHSFVRDEHFWKEMKLVLKTPIIVDTRNMFNLDSKSLAGYQYITLGSGGTK